MTVLTACGIPYFDDLPRYALPALQSAWDKVKINEFGNKFVFTSFCRGMNQVGEKPPSLPVMTSWIHAVQSVDIARPLPSGESETTPAPKDPAEQSTVIACLQADVAGSPDDELLPHPNDKQAWEERRAKSKAETPPSAASSDFQPLTPADFKAPAVDAETSEILLQRLTDRLVDEEEAKLLRDIREQAKKAAALRLRSMLEQMGALNA